MPYDNNNNNIFYTSFFIKEKKNLFSVIHFNCLIFYLILSLNKITQQKQLLLQNH